MRTPSEAACNLKEQVEYLKSHIVAHGAPLNGKWLIDIEDVIALLEEYEQLVTDICELEPCRCCKYDDDCEGSNSIGCTTGGFEFRDPEPGREGK